MKKLTIGSLKAGQAGYSTSTVARAPEAPVRAPERRETVQKTAVPQLKIEQHDKQFHVERVPRQTVLETALQQNIPLDFKCKKGTCGRCRVKVEDGMSLISTPNDAERKRLGTESQQGFRLACQSVFS
ncbi:2Fe-2S iron-sulfur cluster-binding protein [Bacillus piscicola]|uniref:2Fe-2S iron-sulfur cluster-binding protein n=1 Tax=Bacillus piscicola TaxID=1632684 RepID=UPI001F0A038B|nr:2Fe-2S iron-sulfur cluster-binding protein [Bacillus piscicola]